MEEEFLNEEIFKKEEKVLSFKIFKKDFHKYKLLSPLLEIHDTPKHINFKAINEEVFYNFLNKSFNDNDYKVLTIVGSRKNTIYGKEVLNYLLRLIFQENIIIVSG